MASQTLFIASLLVALLAGAQGASPQPAWGQRIAGEQDSCAEEPLHSLSSAQLSPQAH